MKTISAQAEDWMDCATKLAKANEPFKVRHTRDWDFDFLRFICYRYGYKQTDQGADAFLLPVQKKSGSE